MKVLVCGSRHFNDFNFLDLTLLKYVNPGDTVISGMAKGADTLAVIWAENHSLEVLKFPADWDKHGKAAGPIRNTQMLKEGKPDLVVAFMFKDSRGTKNMVEQAKKAGVKTEVINCGDD